MNTESKGELPDNTPPNNPTPVGADPDDWVRLPRPGRTFFGLTRSFLYSLVKQKRIRSVRIKNATGKTGVLLIYRPSVLALITEAELAGTQTELREGAK